MNDVSFAVLDVAPEPYSMTPILLARIGIACIAEEPVHAIALKCQVRIDPSRRPYDDEEAAGLVELFGPREQWPASQHTFLWQHATAMVAGFTGTTQIQMPLECTYDFEVAAAKYLHALHEGAVPLQFLFSGTVFTAGPRGFVVQQVPWDRDERYDMPVTVWHDLMRRHFPNTGWLRLDHDTIEALAAYRAARGLLGLDDAITSLLAQDSARSAR